MQDKTIILDITDMMASNPRRVQASMDASGNVTCPICKVGSFNVMDGNYYFVCPKCNNEFSRRMGS